MTETGTVVTVSKEGRFAFITPDLGGDDVFVPPRMAQRLQVNDRVEFEMAVTDRGRSSRSLKVIERS
jgi:cold shock CspA family protein